MEDDTEEGSGGKHGIDRAEGAVLDASANVAGEQIVKDSILLLKKHVGQLMPFQGAEKEQAKQRRIGALSDSIAGEQREEPFIIPFLGGFFDRLLATRSSGLFLRELRCTVRAWSESV